ncbi:FHA domain-containing protein [Jannaschia sp. CCS1]|uniref:FHA domain-containing protein n=1 Tax=Jannaschia sp. (strain CCS1) TaxID=290400 RepID=UPI000053B7D2|nr:FHA domain-containing protein [Jannaschia sp. CCS1]ABD57059.1 FHA domain containing protein [Jannaschia sp. CCS1]
MSMNRFRNVAVRMRPKSLIEDPQTDGADDAQASASAEVAQPRRIVNTAPRTPPKRNIWDLEDRVADDLPEPSPAPSPATPPPAPTVKHQEPPAPATGGRAKTRILGFHAEALGSVGDATEHPPKAGPVFPAGFLVLTEGPGRGAYFAVTTRVSTIGRGTDQDIALDFGDESISRTGHASVMFDAEQNRFFLGHGNKANAIRRNGSPVLATEEMMHGDTIRIGKTSLRFHAFCGADFTWDHEDEGDVAHD